VVEGWQGQTFDRPLERTREYVEIVRLALSGKRVNYEGQIFYLHDFTLKFRPPRPRVPIYIAAIGPKNVQLAGEIADGWLPIFVSLPHLDTLRTDLAAGAAKSGRSAADVDTAAFIGALVSGNPERDRQLLRRHLAHYVGGMGLYYNRLVAETYGYKAEAAAIWRDYQARSRAAAAKHIGDSLLDELAISGPSDHARARVSAYQTAGVTPLLAFPSGATLGDIAATIEALA
jgi:alkanesulfonate monooxygenase SsuD/methylene tetrahydromethanopterin reductase-like flavin-dependent oxidoreductase (luciferase family)